MWRGRPRPRFRGKTLPILGSPHSRSFRSQFATSKQVSSRKFLILNSFFGAVQNHAGV